MLQLKESQAGEKSSAPLDAEVCALGGAIGFGPAACAEADAEEQDRERRDELLTKIGSV
jgi:hypothetical protein